MTLPESSPMALRALRSGIALLFAPIAAWATAEASALRFGEASVGRRRQVVEGVAADRRIVLYTPPRRDG
jgi:hypothetical protein